MASKDASKALRELSLSIGDFIRYWGFRRVHGAIWTQLYLAKNPLSCTELARRLKLSKSLISPALSELERWDLIHKADSVDEKTILYEAAPDVEKVIKHVLRKREAPMLDEIAVNFSNFKKQPGCVDLVETERLNSLREMISSAQLMLELMLAEKQLMGLPAKIEG